MSTSASPALTAELLTTARHGFRSYLARADKAPGQLTPAEWLWPPAPQANSAAVIVQHPVGNLRSRFPAFGPAAGEKPGRHRNQALEERRTPDAVAAQRQVAHYAYHTEQRVQRAKTRRGANRHTLSVASGQSTPFNARMRAQHSPAANLGAGSGV